MHKNNPNNPKIFKMVNKSKNLEISQKNTLKKKYDIKKKFWRKK